MNQDTELREIIIPENGSIRILDSQGRTYQDADPLTNFNDGDISSVRKKPVTAAVLLRSENISIESIQADTLPLTISSIGFDVDDNFVLLVKGDLTSYGSLSPDGISVVFTGTGGFNISINKEWSALTPIYDDVEMLTTFLLFSSVQPTSGSWNAQGSVFAFAGYFVRTSVPHNLADSTYGYIYNLTGFANLNQHIVLYAKVSADLLFTPFNAATMVYSSSSYGSQSALFRKNNICRLTFDTTEFTDTVVAFQYDDPLVINDPSVANGELYGTDYNIITKTPTYIDVDLQRYVTSFTTTSLTFLSSELEFASFIKPDETVELVFKNGKRKRFKSITGAYEEYEEGQIIVYPNGSAYTEPELVATNHLNLFVHKGAIINFAIYGAKNKNLIIDGQGTFATKIISHLENETGVCWIKGYSFVSIQIWTNVDAYVEANYIVSPSLLPPLLFNHDNENSRTNVLYLKFGKVYSPINSAMLINGNAYITGNSIECGSIGHCLISHGVGTKIFANIDYLKTRMNNSTSNGQYCDVVTMEDIRTGVTDTNRELHLNFKLIELINETSDQISAAVNNISGNLFLYNGTIKSNVAKAAVYYGGFCGGRLKNVRIENSAGAALALSNYYTSPYLSPIQVVGSQAEGNSTDACAIVGHDFGVASATFTEAGAYSNVSFVDSTIRNNSTNAASSGIKVGNNIVNLEFDNVMVATGHTSARGIDKYTYAITNISKAASAVVTIGTHQIGVGQTIKITGVSGMTEVNDQSYVISAVGPTTITLAVDTSGIGFTAYTSGGIAAVPKNIKIKRPLLMRVAKEANFSTYTENSSAVSAVSTLT